MKTLYHLFLVFIFLCAIGSISAAVPDGPTNGDVRIISRTASETTLEITWQDNSSNENFFVIFNYSNGGVGDYLEVFPVENSTEQIISLPDLARGSTVQYVIAAYNADGMSKTGALTPAITITDSTVRYGFEATVGVPFSAELYTDNFDLQSAANMTGLPDWATFTPATRTFSGTPTTVGVHSLDLQVEYRDGFSIQETIPLRILPAAAGPRLASTLPSPTYHPDAGAQSIDLNRYFEDPDCTRAARMTFNVGTVDIILYENATPATVSNFLAYINGTGQGAYDGAMIHRSIPNFAIQGGGYRPIGGTAFESVTDLAPVSNEPGLENIRGTLSMAKLGGNPDSATNEWFINLADNRPNLDFQNGGFTVFGRVAGDGMTVVDSIASLPTGNYPSITVDTVSLSRSDLMAACPMNAATAPSNMEPDKLVVIETASEINPLAYSIVSNTDPSVATATLLSNGILQITPLQAGNCSLTIRVADLDNNQIEQDISIEIRWTFDQWTEAQGLGTGENGTYDDADADLLSNLIEYSLMGDPAHAMPALATIQVVSAETPEPQDYMAIEFSTRNGTTDAIVSVQATNQLSADTNWTEIWNSSLGSSDPQVHSANRAADYTDWVIRDTQASSASKTRFMRVRVDLQ